MKMRVLSALFAFFIACSLFCGTVNAANDTWDGRTAEPYEGGTGTKDDPFLITNGAQLYQLSLDGTSSNTSGKYYTITNDIDLNNIRFSPINSFRGVLDGGGYTIKGLNIVASGTDYAGLIRKCYGTVKNLTLKGSVTGQAETGAFAGHMGDTTGTIINCINHCTVSGGDYTGGIVGRIANADATNISACTNKGNVSGKNYVGGIVGGCESGEYSSDYCKILKSKNLGNVKGNNQIGGIAGIAEYAIVALCANAGAITAVNKEAGGLFGRFSAANVWNSHSQSSSWYYSSVENCYNTGSVTASEKSGGICGYSNAYKNRITNCYNVGSISGNNMSDIYYDDEHIECHNVYYLKGFNTGAVNPSDSVGNDKEDMQLPSGFSGFDFTTIWTWDSSWKYPYPILRDLGIVLAEDDDQPGGDPIDDVIICVNEVTVKVSVSVPEENERDNYILVMAAYNERGWQVACTAKPVTAEDLQDTVTISLQLPESNSKKFTWKVYLLDNSFQTNGGVISGTHISD